MKKIIAVSAVALMMAGSCLAATKQQKAEELINLMNTQAVFDAVYAQAAIPLSCELIMSPADEAELKKEFMQIADMPALMRTLSQFWILHYTDHELDQLLAFYKTDLGKKSIELMPQYTQFSLAEMQKWGEQKGPKFIELGAKLAQKYPKRSGEQTKACIKAKMGK